MISLRLLLWLAAGALASLVIGCGAARPPTLAEQRAVVDASGDAARQGWWAYLAGDGAGAAAAFAQAGDDPLAALGRAQLARDALDPATARREGVRAARGAGRVALLGRVFAREAAALLPRGAGSEGALDPNQGGEGALDPSQQGEGALDPSQRVALTGALHTVRVSFLPHLHRDRLRDHPPREEDGKVRALGGWWALSEGAPRADADGLVLTRWPLAPGAAHIELLAGGPTLAWRDGVLVAATPADRPAAGRVRFTAAGEGPLWVAWASRRRVRAWRWSAPAPGPPVLHGGPVVSGRAGENDWVEVFLAIEQALADGDAGEAGRWLAQAPVSAAFAQQQARLAELDASLPATAARDRARAAWTEALPLAPARARVALARLARRAGEVGEARAQVEGALVLAPESFEAHRERVRALLAAGFVEEAREAVAAAERVAPDRCLMLDDRIALGVRSTDEAVAAFEGCDRPLDAVARLLDDKRPEGALDRLDRLEDEGAQALRLRVRALVGLGRLDEARRRLAEAGSLAEIDDRMASIDLERASDEAALEPLLRGLLADHPTAREALTVVAAWPEWSVFESLRIETEDVIAEYEGTVPLPGPAVRVLDHSALLYFGDGTRLRWVHEVIAVRSREAAEVYGELSLPASDVVPVALYTRKADGRRLFAVDEPAKESLSLPDLEDGDYVVAIYLEPGDNGYLYDSGFLTPRVFFRGVDMPIFRQRLEVFAPEDMATDGTAADGMAADGTAADGMAADGMAADGMASDGMAADDTAPDFQRLVGAPEPEVVRLGARVGLRFEAAGVAVMPPEIEPVPPGLWLASVRVGRRVSLRDDVEFYRDRVLALRQETAAFAAWVRSRAGDGTRAEQVRRLALAVRAEVDGEAGLIRSAVAEAPLSGQGNRALVLSAGLSVLGVPHSLRMARPRSHVPAGPFLQVADFPYPLIELGDGTWIDPGPDRAAVGWLPFLMLGGDSIEVWPVAGPIGPRPLPVRRAVEDSRRVRVRAHWGADGVVRGEVVDTLVGQEASVIGRYLAQLDAEQRPRLVERLLTQAFPTGRVVRFEDPSGAGGTGGAADGPLVLRYGFEAATGDALRLGMFPVQPGRRYAVEGARQIPLSVDLPTRQRVEVRLTSDRAMRVEGRAGVVAEGAARYGLGVEGDDEELTLKARLDVPGGVVAPGDYPAFAGWARAVDARERVTVMVEAGEAGEVGEAGEAGAEPVAVRP